jgi:hypothetical protein
LTRGFVKIGMAFYVADTRRMQHEPLPQLRYVSLPDGMGLLKDLLSRFILGVKAPKATLRFIL